VKLTAMLQVECAANWEAQLVDWAKSAGLIEMAGADTVFPMFDKTIVWDLEVVSTFWLAKVILDAEA
jgi:hypothetical protein